MVAPPDENMHLPGVECAHSIALKFVSSTPTCYHREDSHRVVACYIQQDAGIDGSTYVWYPRAAHATFSRHDQDAQPASSSTQRRLLCRTTRGWRNVCAPRWQRTQRSMKRRCLEG